MANEIEPQDVALENNEEEVEETEVETEETEAEPTDKVKELEAELAKYKRIAARKAKKAETPVTEDAPTTTKPSDLDYGQKAYLKAYGVQGSDELQLVRDFMKRTGEELDNVVNDDIFQAKLGKLREAKAAADAVPKTTNRTNGSGQSDVDYWTAKVESGQAKLEDIPDVSLRRQVLNARIETERSGNKFTPNSVQFG